MLKEKTEKVWVVFLGLEDSLPAFPPLFALLVDV
jgi:hypothetical protein